MCSEIYLFNYANDNTIEVMTESVEHVLSNLSAACNSMLSWYADNFRQVNPDEFQLIIFNNQDTPSCITINNKVRSQWLSSFEFLLIRGYFLVNTLTQCAKRLVDL